MPFVKWVLAIHFNFCATDSENVRDTPSFDFVASSFFRKPFEKAK